MPAHGPPAADEKPGAGWEYRDGVPVLGLPVLG